MFSNKMAATTTNYYLDGNIECENKKKSLHGFFELINQIKLHNMIINMESIFDLLLKK